MYSRVATAFLLGALALAPGSSWAEDAATTLEQLVVEMAHTPEQHSALAEHYRAKASEARASAERHQSMGRSYGSGKLGTRGASLHCKRLSEQNTAMAAEFEELAKLHDAMARETR